MESQYLALFSTQSGRPLDWEIFQKSPLGQLHKTIPFRQLAEQLPIKESMVGRKARFSYEGGIGLQILKHYYKSSDDKLIEQLNGNWQMQYFCGIRLKAGEQIKDGDIVGRWRMFIGEHLDIDLAQQQIIKEWKGKLEETRINLTDATCVESYIRFPTDVKLLWESIEYVWQVLKKISRAMQMPRQRNKYKEIREAYVNYSKQKKKTYQQTQHMKSRLLGLLKKMLEYSTGLVKLWEEQGPALGESPLKNHFPIRLATILKVYEQQQEMFDNKTNEIEDRIVSLHKPYLRPIVRGKENKRVEFGMKLNVMQVNGINFIEHGSFSAFHEGNRLQDTITKHQKYFGKCTHTGMDAIYATNANRKFCSQNNIYTCFVPKGKKGKNEDQTKQVRQLLAKERATRLEGSFGNVKNHYLLDKVKARTKSTEIAWIFFGFFTADAVAMSKKTKPPPKK